MLECLALLECEMVVSNISNSDALSSCFHTITSTQAMSTPQTVPTATHRHLEWFTTPVVVRAQGMLVSFKVHSSKVQSSKFQSSSFQVQKSKVQSSKVQSSKVQSLKVQSSFVGLVKY